MNPLLKTQTRMHTLCTGTAKRGIASPSPTSHTAYNFPFSSFPFPKEKAVSFDTALEQGTEVEYPNYSNYGYLQ